MVSSSPERATNCHCDVTGASQALREAIQAQHPPLAPFLVSNFDQILKTKGFAAASQNLYRLHERLSQRDFSVSLTPDALKVLARDKAALCSRMAKNVIPTVALEKCAALAAEYALSAPKPQGSRTASSCLNRLFSERWWLKQFRQKQAKTIEAVARDIGLVNKHASAYSSLFAQTRRQIQKEQSEAFLESTFIRNEAGEEFSLKDIAQGNVSNPAIRRAELMVRLKGFELVADQLGHVAMFYTITAPSRMHARLGKTGRANNKYDGSTYQEIRFH